MAHSLFSLVSLLLLKDLSFNFISPTKWASFLLYYLRHLREHVEIYLNKAMSLTMSVDLC